MMLLKLQQESSRERGRDRIFHLEQREKGKCWEHGLCDERVESTGFISSM
jgi:hypothetical protein